MKHLKKVLLLLLAAIMLIQCVACKKDPGNNAPTNDDPNNPVVTKKYDNETTSVNFAIGLPDGVFHPMFSTSAYDSEIAGMTQISMLNADAYGSPSYGEGEPVVTLDMLQEMIDAEGHVTEIGSNAAYTTYKFLLKNGIQFSDGTPLTIKDVLFNMYVYLDPAYNGSTTMYAVDIVGLAAYRTQNPDADKEYQDRLNENMATRVTQRMDRFKAYYKALTLSGSEKEEALKAFTEEQIAEIMADTERAKTLFRVELNTDYTSAVDSVESANEEYVFQYCVDGKPQPWEIFCLNEGLIGYATIGATGRYDKEDYITADGKEKKRYKLKDYSELKAIVDEAVANKAAGVSDDDAIRDAMIGLVFEHYTSNREIISVVTSFNTASELRAELQVEELSKYIRENSTADGQKRVPNISGITYEENVTSFNGKTYADGHTVLSIKINKVDPKAIWDFGFTVSPMHYYSNEAEVSRWDGVNNFGLSFNDTNFRDNVLKAPEKIGLPVGGGAYKASNAPGTNKVEGSTFFKDNTVYFERNTYFYTTGAEINNAKIKYLRYQVVSNDQMLTALESGAIDFAEISATNNNINAIDANANLKRSLQDNNGYGYVGINPRYVSDPVVRRAIMYAMDTTIIVNNYYTNGMGSNIWRPMSSNSWAYPKGSTKFYHYDNEVLESNLRTMLEEAGYTKQDGVYGKTDSDGKWNSLKYTFTIAGETNDHPAYTMFAEAAALLNKIGMEITVKNDAQALSKLSNGSLAVWAAAWSSAIDPDMYQVYHMDSQATSVKNWGYDQILNDTESKKYNVMIELKSYRLKYVDEEWCDCPVVPTIELIRELSHLIDLGRSTLDQDQRAAYYKDALDVIMELAVELPTYQRNNMYAYNVNKINVNSLTPESEITQYNGVIAKIWELDLC